MVNIRIIKLLLNDLKLIAKNKNIGGYKGKSKEDLIKALSEPKSETKPKTSKQTPKQILKPETKPKTKPETKPIPKPGRKLEPKLEPELEMKVNQKKLKKLRKDFDELRHKFSNKDEIREYRKAFYDAKKDILSESKMKKLNEGLNKLKKCLELKKFHSNVDSVDYEDLDNLMVIMILPIMINTEKLIVLEHYLKSFIEIITKQ